jgi:Heavy metal associated domain 2
MGRSPPRPSPSATIPGPELNACLVHHLPGRLRLRSAGLKGNANVPERVGFLFREIRGVISVEANPRTGSLLIEYDPTIVAPGKVTEMLTPQGVIRLDAAYDAGPMHGWIDQLADAAGNWFANAVAEQLALTVLRALA